MEHLKLPTLLIISDNPSIGHWIKSHLDGQFYILDASTSSTALEMTKSTHLDFIICDSQFEEMSALELTKQLRQINSAIPILLITGRLKKIFRDAAIHAGVTDFLNDELSMEELQMRIATGQKTAKARNKTSEISTRIKESPKPLSKEYFKNRILLNEKALRLLADMRKTEEPVTLLLISIDQFQKLQESEGIVEADSLLPRLYDRLSQVLKPDDLLIPASNGLFILLLPRISTEEGKKIAEALRRSVQHEPFILAQKPLHLTISIAISSLKASEEQYKRMVSYASKILRQAHATTNLIIPLDKET